MSHTSLPCSIVSRETPPVYSIVFLHLKQIPGVPDKVPFCKTIFEVVGPHIFPVCPISAATLPAHEAQPFRPVVRLELGLGLGSVDNLS